MSNALKICAVILLLAASTAGCAEPIPLEYKFTKGEVSKYRITLWVSLDLSELAAASGKTIQPPTDVSLTMTMVQRTLAVNPDGSAKVRTVFTAPVVGGIKMPPSASKQATALLDQGIVTTISKRGLPIAIHGVDKAMSSYGLQKIAVRKLLESTSATAFLPDGPMEVGQSWNASIPTPFNNSQIYMQTTLAGADEEIWNLGVARIRQTCTAKLDLKEIMEGFLSAFAGKVKQGVPDLSSTSGYVSANGQMTHYFAPSIGKLLKSQGDLEVRISVTPPPGLAPKGAPSTMAFGVNLRMAMTRFN